MRTNWSSRSIDSACCASARPGTSDDLRDLREALGRFEGQPLISEDCVPFLVDLVRVDEAWTTSLFVTPMARPVVGAPIVRGPSRTSCQLPAWRDNIMIVPTPLGLPL